LADKGASQFGGHTSTGVEMYSHKAKHPLTTQSSNHTTWYLPNWVKVYFQVQTYTQLFIAAVFLISIGRKQARCLSAGE
jgi:hypothetical protein